VVAQGLAARTIDVTKITEAEPNSAEQLEDARHKEAVELGATELRTLLDAKHKGWATKCGLQRVTSNDGYTEWVLPEHVERFEKEGIDCLGAATESGEERATKAEAENRRLRQSSVVAQETSTELTSVAASSKRAPAKSSACVMC
jgi:hypothetical protein